MSSSRADDSLLLIRCPSCGQRFKVGEDLRNRTVECGGCEHHFQINDTVIVRGRKFYPGERQDPGLNRFQRVPLAGGESATGVQPMRYNQQPEPVMLEPASPQRVIAGALGVAGMLLMALLLIFGASRGGFLDGMVLGKRLLIAGFAGVLGGALLVYANPRARWKAAAVSVLLAAGLLALPFVYRTGSLRKGTPELAADAAALAEPPTVPDEERELQELRTRIGTEPLEREIAKMEAAADGKHALGLWLRGLREANKNVVRDYILRVTGADPTTHPYPRDGGDYLLVVTGITQTLQELADHAAAFGTVEKFYPRLSLVEVRVRNEEFVEGAMEKLADRDNPAFYDLNKRELESIDPERVKRAVQRLIEAEPRIFRDDFTRKLISLLEQEGIGFPGEIAAALMNWAEDLQPAAEAALRVLKRRVAAGEAVPADLVALVVKARLPEVVPILEKLWLEDPVTWEQAFGEFGSGIELSLLERFPTTSSTQRYSVVRLLGRVGGEKSLALLEDVDPGEDPELKVLLQQALKAIRGRVSG